MCVAPSPSALRCAPSPSPPTPPLRCGFPSGDVFRFCGLLKTFHDFQNPVEHFGFGKLIRFSPRPPLIHPPASSARLALRVCRPWRVLTAACLRRRLGLRRRTVRFGDAEHPAVGFLLYNIRRPRGHQQSKTPVLPVFFGPVLGTCSVGATLRVNHVAPYHAKVNCRLSRSSRQTCPDNMSDVGVAFSRAHCSNPTVWFLSPLFHPVPSHDSTPNASK